MNRPPDPSGSAASGRHRPWVRLLLLAAIGLGPVLTGPAALLAHPIQESESGSICVCDRLRDGTGWCEACGRGYLAGVEIDSPALYEILDPHGHEMDPERMPCDRCREARSSDGFCEGHGIGYVGGLGYMTRLTYLLALAGTPSPPGDLEARTEAEWARLRIALRHLDRCELCAVACFMNGRCPECNVYYRNGEAVSAEIARRTPR